MTHFSKDAARRIVRKTRRDETTPRKLPGRSGPSQLPIARDAYTTSAITARTGNKLGSGTFVYCRPMGLDGVTMTKTGEPEATGYNNTGGAIASGTYGYVLPIAGRLRFIEADCLISGTVAPEDAPGSEGG